MAQPDRIPEEAVQDMVKALHLITEHAATIAHVKRAFFLAYGAEGFDEQQALELCKNLSSF